MNLDQAKALDRKGWHKIADKLKPETRNFIDGKFVEARKGRTFESINPTDNSVICEMARSDASDVDAAVKSARKVFRAGTWSRINSHCSPSTVRRWSVMTRCPIVRP